MDEKFSNCGFGVYACRLSLNTILYNENLVEKQINISQSIPFWRDQCLGTEIVFEVSEDALDGDYSVSALAFSIHTQGKVIDELLHNVREAVDL